MEKYIVEEIYLHYGEPLTELKTKLYSKKELTEIKVTKDYYFFDIDTHYSSIEKIKSDLKDFSKEIGYQNLEEYLKEEYDVETFECFLEENITEKLKSPLYEYYKVYEIAEDKLIYHEELSFPYDCGDDYFYYGELEKSEKWEIFSKNFIK